MTSGDDPAEQSPSLRAATWSVALERRLRRLPTPGRRRDVNHNERVLHQPGLERHPYGRELVRPENGQPLLGGIACPHTARTRSRAALVMVGRMADLDFRFRSFYLDGAEPLAVAVHERPLRGEQTGLLKGVQLQRLAHGRVPVQVPRVLEARSVRLGTRLRGTGLRGLTSVPPRTVDVVLEEWLPGRPVAVDDPRVVPELLETVVALWDLEPVRATRLDPGMLARTRQRFVGLLEQGQRWGVWPEDVPTHSLGQKVLDLLDRDPTLTVGASHGDPGLGNALRQGHGGLVLVDWEDAGLRTLSHDVLKVLTSGGVSPEDWVERHPTLPRTHHSEVLPTGPQLAVALLQFLSGWKGRTRAARRRGAVPAHRRRMHSMVRAVDSALA